MRRRTTPAGTTLVEAVAATAIFTIMVVLIFQVVDAAVSNLRSHGARDGTDASGTRILDRISRDVRESSTAYVFTGDWLATRSTEGIVTIEVARNYFSANPGACGAGLEPGLSREGWTRCPNEGCSWNHHRSGNLLVPTLPHAFLAHPVRNNPQSGQPSLPPSNLAWDAADGHGRQFEHLSPGRPCPYCGTSLSAESFFTGILLFSPRNRDRSFSYGGASGHEVLWESMIFLCPYRDPATGTSDLRRYVFHASSLADGSGRKATLVDLLDLDGNGIVESPPMTGPDGRFLLDAEGECFHLESVGEGGNVLFYARWDEAAGRSFEIAVHRADGRAEVTVRGGAFATGGPVEVLLETSRMGLGVTDFDASTFFNNPTWRSGNVQVNPTGVAEPGVVRITVQTDRPGDSRRGNAVDREETIQSTSYRPRN